MTKASDTGDATPRMSTSETIARDIVRGLYEGRFAPGQRLAEPDLMSHYGVGRSTAREAIKQLTADGITVTLPFRGAQIRKLSRREAANIFAVTEVVLGLAARQAAGNISRRGNKSRVRQCLKDIKKAARSKDQYIFSRSRNRFFKALIEISENEELGKILPRLQVHLVRNQPAVPGDFRVAGYSAMTEAIVSGNQQEAEEAARTYVAAMAELVLPGIGE